MTFLEPPQVHRVAAVIDESRSSFHFETLGRLCLGPKIQYSFQGNRIGPYPEGPNKGMPDGSFCKGDEDIEESGYKASCIDCPICHELYFNVIADQNDLFVFMNFHSIRFELSKSILCIKY